MNEIPDKVLDGALSLPSEARIALVDRLLESLNLPQSGKANEQWTREVDRRARELDRGEAELVPGEEVLERIRTKFRPRMGENLQRPPGEEGFPR